MAPEFALFELERGDGERGEERTIVRCGTDTRVIELLFDDIAADAPLEIERHPLTADDCTALWGVMRSSGFITQAREGLLPESGPGRAIQLDFDGRSVTLVQETAGVPYDAVHDALKRLVR